MIEIFLIFILAIFVIIGLVMAFGWKNLHYRVLSRDMVKWQREGWVNAEGASAILDDKRPAGLGGRLVFLVGLLGAILLLFAAISFVAANWADMSRLSRLIWLMVVLWITFLVGWRLTTTKHPLLAEIAYLMGVGLFGVNITLIAQMFHIDSHPPDGVLMWTIGALVSAALLQSRAALFLTFAGALSWSMMEVAGYEVVIHWPFLIVWLAAFGLTLWGRWTISYHLAFLSLTIWTIIAVIRYAVEGHWAPHGVFALFVISFMLMLAISFVWQANRSQSDESGFENWLERYAIIGLLPAIFVLQILPFKLANELYGSAATASQAPLYMLQGYMGWLPITLVLLVGALILLVLTWREKLLRTMDLAIFATIAAGTLAFALASISNAIFGGGSIITSQTHDFLSTWVFGAAFMAMLLWLIEFGHRRGSDLYVWVALLTFAAEVLYIYFRIFGSLLETSLFFLIGGLLTIGLAFFLYRLHNRLDKTENPPATNQAQEAG
jgi:uncharacterized membrane protein